MRIIKPDWMSHEGTSIHSVDVSRDGKRLATGGLDAKVRLWNMKSLRRSKSSPSACLSVLTDHTAGVNCVRWSPNQNVLASASDDHSIFLWQHVDDDDDNAGTTFGQSAVGTEAWKAYQTFRGHKAEVVTLAWSHDGTRLASCSLDGLVIVWNAATAQALKRLSNHDNHVKGVSFDPTGNYLASQGDDKAVRIFKTDTWEEVAVVKEPYSKASISSSFLRLNWSADGLSLLTMHATNDSFPVCSIIDRKALKRDIDLVGHTGPPIASRPYPKLVGRKARRDSDDLEPASIMAVTGQDGCVSVWVTGNRYPLVAIKDLFPKSAVDCAWNPQGALELVVCSLDGSIAYLHFAPNEFGQVYKDAAAKRVFLKLYGQSKTNTASVVSASAYSLLHPAGNAKSVDSQPMDDDDDDIEEEPADPSRASISQPPTAQNRQSATPSGNGVTHPRTSSAAATSSVVAPRRVVPVQQIESRTAGGKRRIAPMSRVSTSKAESPKRAHRLSEGSVAVGLAAAPFRKLPQLHQLPAASTVDEFHHRVRGVKPRLLHVTNNFDKQSGNLCLLRCLSDADNSNEPVWRMVLPSSCLCLGADHRVVACATRDGLIHVVSLDHGDRLIPAFTVGRHVVLLKIADSCLFVVTTDARLNVWRIDDGPKLQRLHSNQDLTAVLAGRGKEALADVGLLDDQLAVYIQDNKRLTHVFGWDGDLHVWTLLASHKTNTALGAVARDLTSDGQSTALHLQRRMQTSGQPQIAKAMVAPGTNPITKPLQKLDSCQQMLTTARQMKDAVGFEALLLLYTRVLAEEKQSSQLRRLCDGLLGLPPATDADIKLVSCLGLDKRGVLRKVLTVLAQQSSHYGGMVEDFIERLKAVEADSQ